MKVSKHLLLISAFWCSSNSAFAQSWTQTSAPSTNWISVASSADGKTLVAAVSDGEIYSSTNSGVTWQKATNAPNFHGAGTTVWSSVTASAEGAKLAATSDYYNPGAPGDGTIFISTNSGAGWTRTLSNGYFQSIMGLQSIASSADGNTLAAVGYNIFTSTNRGATWLTNNLFTSWQSVACSADGSKVKAAVYGGGIYASTNSGITWVQTGASNMNWLSIVSSADGGKLAARVDGGLYAAIYTSTNFGATWSSNNLPAARWMSVASSSDGARLVAAATNGLIYTSTNSGNSWQSNSVPTNYWRSVASSADGTKLVAVVYGGGIYTSYTVPRPSLSLTFSNKSLAFSWIVASTNFVLQKGTNLAKATSWMTLTNTPVLNLTNLQNQIILSKPGSNLFYRLKSP